MIIAVDGCTGAGAVKGVSSAHPTGLWRAVGGHPGEHVIFCVPDYAEVRAREQAHVLVAADPTRRVSVSALAHHVLTIAVIARSVLDRHQGSDGWTDPGEAAALVEATAATSLSLVWFPKVVRLKQPAPAFADRLASVFSSPGYFVRLGPTPTVMRAAAGVPGDGDADLFTAGVIPALLQSQLAARAHQSLTLDMDPARPYARSGGVELSVVTQPPRPVAGPPCPVCGAAMLDLQCAFCRVGPVAVEPSGRPAGPLPVSPAAHLDRQKGTR